MAKEKYPHLSDFEKRILLVLEQRICSLSYIAREMNENRQFIRGVLESLRKRNHVKRTTVGKSTVYLPTEHANMFKLLEEDKFQEERLNEDINKRKN